MFPTTVGCLKGSFQFDVFQKCSVFLTNPSKKVDEWIVFDEFWVVASGIKNLIDR
jgi:hypothetical protein